MRETLRRICELQPAYSSENTPEMQERGQLIRQKLPGEVRALQETLARAVNGRVKVSQRAAQNVATLGLARSPGERALASGRPRFS